MPIIAAHIYCHFNHRTPHPINTNLSYVENFLLMITGELPHPIVSRTLEVLLIAHAEHELNCSTAMMRHLLFLEWMFILVLLEVLLLFMEGFMEVLMNKF